MPTPMASNVGEQNGDLMSIECTHMVHFSPGIEKPLELADLAARISSLLLGDRFRRISPVFLREFLLASHPSGSEDSMRNLPVGPGKSFIASSILHRFLYDDLGFHLPDRSEAFPKPNSAFVQVMYW